MKKRRGFITEIELREAVEEIAEIIHMQMPLRYQDKWLDYIEERGIWKPQTEEILREQEQ
jgi:hypothetical protein